MSESVIQHCVLCRGLLAGRFTGLWDSVILETPEFVVVPTKGSLVPGWLLVVSKKHLLCSGALEPAAAMDAALRVVETARELVESTLGPATVFEHGPSRAGTAVGCGIDHLHLHVAPLPGSLKAAVANLYPTTRWQRAGSWSELRSLHSDGLAYMAVQEPSDSLYWSPAPRGVRQPLRRAVATAIGSESEFDYNLHPHADNVATTIRLLARV